MSSESALTVGSDRMSWWRDAKFGMFIHWGLYALPAGEWEGREIPGIGEWIMKRAKIPISVYGKLAEQFNPVQFNAREWVQVAKSAGMKYIVITAKHHDGFCMYHSKVSSYNIVDATPFGRDPMKELAEACAEADLKLCFYYSQTQDWYEKDAVGNDWDFAEPTEARNFQKYLDEKVKPQVTELLTQYGPIGLIWFDTPMIITDEQSRELRELVHTLQPDCIVNGRVGNGLGDYVCLGDNETPAKALQTDWETCATLNHTWGFKKNDHHWKTANQLVRLLSDIVGKGGTYLLNVGPTAEGIIPQPSIDMLQEVGRWLSANEEAVRGAGSNPFETEFPWGTITTKPGRVYAHLFEWPKGQFALNGLKNRVNGAWLLEEPGTQLSFSQSRDGGRDRLTVALPDKAPNAIVSVLVLDIDGSAEADNTLSERADGNIVLEAHRADLHKAGDESTLALSRSGVTNKWSDPNDWLSWDFVVTEPGTFQVEIVSLAEKARESSGETVGRWEGGHTVSIEAANQQLTCVLNEDERITNSRALYFNRIISRCGTLQIAEAGSYTLKLKPVDLKFEMSLGLKLVSVQLKR